MLQNVSVFGFEYKYSWQPGGDRLYLKSKGKGSDSAPVLYTEPRQLAFAMNITEKSTKDEIISASCEIIDSQAEKISRLEQQQTALFWVVGLISVWLILF